MDRHRAAHEMEPLASRGSWRIKFLKVTVLSLRTTRSCLLYSTSSSSMLASLMKALSGCAGLTVKRRLKSAIKCCAR